jgi:hypothetical protein
MSEPAEGDVILMLLQEGARLGLKAHEVDIADLRQVVRDTSIAAGRITGRLIKLFITGDDPRALRTIELDNRWGMAVMGRRSYFKKALAREELSRSCIYLLIRSAGTDDLFVNQRQDVQALPVVRLGLHEVEALDMTAVERTESVARAVFQPQAAAGSMSAEGLQPSATPDPLNPVPTSGSSQSKPRSSQACASHGGSQTTRSRRSDDNSDAINP